jgi:hypothetical protein
MKFSFSFSLISCFVTIVLLFLSSIQALDVSFIPNDTGDPSIPLSANYRDRLRKLCKLLTLNQPLPKEINEKKEILEKMCFKLSLDDQNIDSASPTGWFRRKFPSFSSFSSSGGKRWLYIGLTVTGSALLWKYHPLLMSGIKRFLKKSDGKSLSDDHHGGLNYGNDRIAQQDEIRLARLKKLGGGSSSSTTAPSDSGNSEGYSNQYDFSNNNPNKLL